MKENKKDKKFMMHKVFATITFIVSIAYLSYIIITTDNILTNIDKILMPILIFLISLVVFISAIKTKSSKTYIIVSIILLSFISFSFLTDKKVILLPEEDKITSYVNKEYKDFSDWAKNNGIEIVTEYEYSDTIEKGNIIRTDINEGTFIKDIKKITVTVSDGPNYDKLLIIPSMLGWNVDDVTKYVEENFLINVTINYEESDSEKDIIFKQSKNGELRRNGELILTASIGNKDDLPDTIEMIDLKNKNIFNALLWLKRNGIKYELDYEFSEKDKNIIKFECESDEVVVSSNSPEIGKVEEKITVEKNNSNDIKIAFSSRYMMDAIKTIESKNVVLSFNNDVQPIIVLDEEDDTLLQLILPIKTY